MILNYDYEGSTKNEKKISILKNICEIELLKKIKLKLVFDEKLRHRVGNYYLNT
jgi:hypothetical protein